MLRVYNKSGVDSEDGAVVKPCLSPISRVDAISGFNLLFVLTPALNSFFSRLLSFLPTDF